MKIAVVLFSDELALANTLYSVTAPCELWVLGGLCGYPKNELCFEKIVEIIPEAAEIFREPICCAAAVEEYYQENPVDIILLSDGVRGNDLAARIAAATDGDGFLGTKELLFHDGKIYVQKPVYSNNLDATFCAESFPLVLSGSPKGSGEAGKAPENQEIFQFKATAELPAWLSDIECEVLENADLLKDARLVIAAGRGVGRTENFKKLDELAEKLGGALGGTRPTVYDGKMPAARMLGMSAAVVSPDCCIAFGASGAAPFMAGVEKSRLLIAVNSDPNALIFEHCDLGIAADCNEFALALLNEL
ncbi:MAG: electron transfer flavoprotein subunit alpha/FixB family protein [Oscillospiraceae bacterium]